MNNTFKPLAIAAAVAAVTAGFTGAVNAQQSPAGSYPSMGDAAIVPYYTVQGGWVTGVHITNTSDQTQVIKVRLRRAEDSKDILDYNLILSPFDMWTGTVRGDDTAMEMVTADKSCTAPEFLVGGTQAPVRAENLKGAQEGYIEIIGMAQSQYSADDSDSSTNQPISVAANHGANGSPADCDSVRSNFFVTALTDNDLTQQTGVSSTDVNKNTNGSNVYFPTDNALKVSYFIRDNDSGSEFGGNAVHFSNFSGYAMMTHQEYGLNQYLSKGPDALNGYDFPDLRGGGNNTGGIGTRDSWQLVRQQLAASSLINDWSYNSSTGASVDWTVTLPGQYEMVDIYTQAKPPAGLAPYAWDYREMPVVATFSLYDREENEGVPGDLVFSPSPAPDAALLPYEVNVITWGPDTVPPVLDAAKSLRVDPTDAGITAEGGWASLAVEGTDKVSLGVTGGTAIPFAVCDAAGGPVGLGLGGQPGACVMTSVGGPVPIVGFAAWDRTFDNPDLSYGRIVEHSFQVSN